MVACADALADVEAAGRHRPKALAVTLLTSVDEKVMEEVRLEGEPATMVPRLATLAAQAGLDGVVASPREVSVLRAARGPDFLIVVPGVRPAGADADDHARSATPRDAIAAGADYVVVGRPITQAASPAGAAEAVIAEIAEGLAESGEGSP